MQKRLLWVMLAIVLILNTTGCAATTDPYLLSPYNPMDYRVSMDMVRSVLQGLTAARIYSNPDIGLIFYAYGEKVPYVVYLPMAKGMDFIYTGLTGQKDVIAYFQQNGFVEITRDQLPKQLRDLLSQATTLAWAEFILQLNAIISQVGAFVSTAEFVPLFIILPLEDGEFQLTPYTEIET